MKHTTTSALFMGEVPQLNVEMSEIVPSLCGADVALLTNIYKLALSPLQKSNQQPGGGQQAAQQAPSTQQPQQQQQQQLQTASAAQPSATSAAQVNRNRKP